MKVVLKCGLRLYPAKDYKYYYICEDNIIQVVLFTIFISELATFFHQSSEKVFQCDEHNF